MKHKTGLVYSERYQEHNTGPGHPERPERVSHVYQFLKSSSIFKHLVLLKPRSASPEEIALIHPKSYIDRVKIACESGQRHLDSADVVISPASYEIALLAAGGVLTLIDAVMEQKVLNGFALVRPPGHHAEREMALGFCLFNNVAIAARYVQAKYGIKRVLIIDWDVHHGNGTQHLFEDDPSVFYFSTHQYPYYPGTGSYLEKGTGAGKGFTLNVPMPAGSGDAQYIQAFEEILYPEASKFRPEIIFISAGFDAHQDDPLAQMNLSEKAYGFFTDVAMKITNEQGHERIVSVLEGGYNLEMMSKSIYIHLKHLIGEAEF